MKTILQVVEIVKKQIREKMLEEQKSKRKIFFTSDWHINDNRLNLYGRDLIFKNEKEVNEHLKDVFNKTVGKNDLTYFLGDISMDKDGLDILNQLNGKKILIKGNYDISKENGGTANFEINDKMLLKYFDEVYDELEIEIGGEKVYLNHFPTNAKENVFNIVGHIHGLWKVQRNSVNVGVDIWHFTPVSEELIKFQMNGIRVHYDQNVFVGELISNIKHRVGTVQVLRAPEQYKVSTFEENQDIVVFLAGPIQGANWHENFLEKIQEGLKNVKTNKNIILVCPKRLGEFSKKDFVYEEQVNWESEYLEKASKQGIIVFWLAKEVEKIEGRSFAQTTRWEISEWWTKSQQKYVKIIVGADKGFEGQRYITYKFKLTNPDFEIITNEKDMINEIVKQIKKMI